MSSIQVQLELPEELARRLDPTGADLAARVLEAVVLRLFEEKAISSGRAAELLGVTKDDFLEVLARHNVPYFNQTVEEVLSDARVAAEARKPGPA